MVFAVLDGFGEACGPGEGVEGRVAADELLGDGCVPL